MLGDSPANVAGSLKSMPFWTEIDRGLQDCFYPRDCVVTQEPMEVGVGRYLSPNGAERLERIHDPRCDTCGHPFLGLIEGDLTCPHCFELHPAFHRALCPFQAHGAVRAIIHQVKYYQKPWLIDDLVAAALQDPLLRRHLLGATLVPVPLHPSRELDRGYNQALRLAHALHRAVPATEVAPLLQKSQPTVSQTRLGRQARRRNVLKAFSLKPTAQIHPTKRYVVIDDVLTTGATLHACAQVLRQAGATLVDAAALAHG